MLLRTSSAPSVVFNSFLSHVDYTSNTHDHTSPQCSRGLSPNSHSSFSIQPSPDHASKFTGLHNLMSRVQSQPNLQSCFDDNNNSSSSHHYHSNNKLSNGDHVLSNLTLDNVETLETSKPKALSLALSTDNDGGGNFDQSSTKTGKDDDDEDGFTIRENYYRALLEEDPNNPLLLRNFGEFLYKYSSNEKDVRKCEAFYERAILADPSDADTLSQYAKIQWDVHKDRERAEVYYDKAIQSSPDDCYVMASYASFLWDVEDDDEALDVSALPLITSPMFILAT